MQVVHEEGSKPVKIWLGNKEDGSIDIEDAALNQAKNIARLPFIASNGVAMMPDAHLGVGASVGTVIATEKALIPSAVGVDIGCGMNAVRLSLKASDLPESLKEVRNQIERDVPLGAGGHHKNAVRDLSGMTGQLVNHGVVSALEKRGDWIAKACEQMGTLGSGNHFIELCVDENEDVWIMLHSGSRGVGNMIGSHYIEKAKEFVQSSMIDKFVDNFPLDLSFLPEGSPLFNDYVEAVGWAQNWALQNRKKMMEAVIAALRRRIPVDFTITQEAINCHHNYVEKENHFGRNMWVTRKGAIRARAGDLGIIPGSMGQKSYIVRGKGNPESYCSCSHGAGRAMSRAEAKRRFNLADLAEQTMGVECRKDADVIDEIPSSYKRLDVVMANQTDLVEVVHTLKAVLCVKGN